jgi:hypothetical protein
MSLDIRKGTTPTIPLVVEGLLAPIASAVARVVSPANVEISADLEPTIDPAEDIIEAVSSGTELDVDDATQFVPGGRYLLLGHSGAEIVEVDRINATDDRLFLASRPSGQARVGDQLWGATVSAPLTADCTQDLGLSYRIEWTITDAAGGVYYPQTVYHVVEMPLGALVTPAMVSRALRGYASDSVLDKYGLPGAREIARLADDRLRQMIEQIGRRPALYGDPAQFSQAAAEAINVTLASHYLLTPAVYDKGVDEWRKHSSMNLQREFDAAVQRLGWYDQPENREPESAPVAAVWSARIKL